MEHNMVLAKQVIGMVGVVGLSAMGALAQQSWQQFGNFTEGAVYDLHVHNGELYLAGRNGSPNTGLGAFVRRWDGTQWVWVGNQLLVERPGAIARELTTHNSELYVVGQFDDGVYRQAAKWDGNAWLPVGDGLPTIPGRTTVGWDVESYDGRLWVVSIIGDPQGQPQTSLKVLQGSQWVDPPGGALADVYSLSVVDGQMYAGRTTGELLRYENGTFVSLGVVAPAAVRSVARFGGRLHAGLAPRGLVNSPSVSPVAIQLDGGWKQATTFFAVRAPAFVAAMEVHDGELYVAGGGVGPAVPIPGEQGSAVARWAPGVRATPTPQFEAARSLIRWQGQLLAGVENSGGGEPYGVYRLAGVQDPSLQISTLEVPLACDGATRSLTVTAPGIGSTLVFRENLLTGLVDLPQVTFGASGNLNINVPGVQNGEFRYIVTNSAGSVATDIVRVRGIDIDFNNNRVFPEDQDVMDFFTALAGGTCEGPTTQACDSIDINVNGVYPEDADVIAFFTNLAGGCE
jgi:hypothetical protein